MNESWRVVAIGILLGSLTFSSVVGVGLQMAKELPSRLSAASSSQALETPSPGSGWNVSQMRAAPMSALPDQEPGIGLAGGIPTGPLQLTSPEDPAGTTQILVSLKFSNETQLGQLLSELSDPSSPEYHHYLTHAQFDSQFGASPAVYGSLVHYFQSFGVSQLTTHPDRLSISFQATPSQVLSVFHTGLEAYRSPIGQPFFAPDSMPELSSFAVPYIAEAQGFSNYSQYLNHPDSQVVTQDVLSLLPSILTGASRSTDRQTAAGTIPSPGSASNPFAPTTVNGLTYDQPVTLTSSSSCDSTTCGQFIETPDLQVAYNETGLFARYGYPVNATVVTLLWTDLIDKGSRGTDGNSFCNAQTSGTYAWDFFMPDVTAYWNYTLPNGEPMPRAISMPQTGTGTYDYPATSPGNQGYSASCNADGDEGENTLDVSTEGTLDPGANVFQIFGQGASTTSIETGMADVLAPFSSEFSATGGFDTARNIADLANASIIANSWTTGSAASLGTAWNNDLKEAQVLGITVLGASGDDGTGATGDIAPPAVESYNTYGDIAVGGTTLVVNSTTLQRTASHLASWPTDGGVGGGEIVWYEPDGSTYGFSSTYGTVGGVASSSNNYAPTWQNESADAHNVIIGIMSSGGRAEPDVASIANDTLMDLDEGVYSLNITCWVSSACTKVSANGDGTTVGGTYFVGTSIAVQATAGIVGMIDYALHKVGQPNVGFIDPAVYSAGQLEYAGDLTLRSFHGITLYHNAEPQTTYGAFSSGGWDADDGWGAIDAGNYTQNTMTYAFTVSESGLPSGTSWSVTLTPKLGDTGCAVSGSTCTNYVTAPSTTPTVVFNEPFGGYSYSIGGIAGYTSSPSSGTAFVNGANVDQSVTFTATLPPAPTDLTATAISSTAIALSWTLPTGTLTDGSYYEFAGPGCTSQPVGFDTGGAYVTSVQVLGLSPGTPYSFKVASWASSGEGPTSVCATATTPAGLTATAVSSTAIYLSWALPTETLADGSYYEFAGSGCSGTPVGFDTGGPSVTSVIVNGLSPETTYSFEVASWTSGGELPVGNCATVTMPGSLAATAVSSVVINLAWDLPSDTLTDGSYYEFAGPGCSGTPVGYDTGGPDVDSVTVPGLSPGTTYSFEVASWTSGGELPVGNCATTTTSGPLTATAVSDTAIALTWTLPSGPLTDGSYYEFAGPGCSGTPVGYDTGGPDVDSVTVPGLSPGTTYSFEVASWTSGGELPVSNCASATTPPITELHTTVSQVPRLDAMTQSISSRLTGTIVNLELSGVPAIAPMVALALRRVGRGTAGVVSL